MLIHTQFTGEGRSFTLPFDCRLIHILVNVSLVYNSCLLYFYIDVYWVVFLPRPLAEAAMKNTTPKLVFSRLCVIDA